MNSNPTIQKPQSEILVDHIQALDLSAELVTLIGTGGIGNEYLKALTLLNVHDVRLIRRSTGGFESLTAPRSPNEVAIVAVPVDELSPAVTHLLKIGFKKILCEKPISLWSSQLEILTQLADSHAATVWCAFNRRTYPSYVEAAARLEQEGGVTSSHYTFTEFPNAWVSPKYSSDTQARWGIANSLHVISMVHGLIGNPSKFSCNRTGSLEWHPTGSAFTGSGVTSKKVLFSYQADWESKGRWSIDLHTKESIYRLCPLEKLFRKTTATSDFIEIPVKAFSDTSKPGFLEETAASLSDHLRQIIPLTTLKEATELTRYAEYVFGYSSTPGSIQ